MGEDVKGESAAAFAMVWDNRSWRCRHVWKEVDVVVYALWDLVTETLLVEGEDPATVLDTMRDLRASVSPDVMPVFGLTEYHPAMRAHMSYSDTGEIEAHLAKRVAARRKRQG